MPESQHAVGLARPGEALPGATLVLAGLDYAAAAWMIFCVVILSRSGDRAGLFLLTMLAMLALLFVSVVSLVGGGVRYESRIVRRVLLGGTIALALVIVVPVALIMALILRT